MYYGQLFRLAGAKNTINISLDIILRYPGKNWQK